MATNIPDGTSKNGATDFGANDWLVEEMFAKFRENRDSVDRTWWPTLERYEASLTHTPRVKESSGDTRSQHPPKAEPAPQAKPSAKQARTTARPAQQ